jgi:hypothetical protein
VWLKLSEIGGVRSSCGNRVIALIATTIMAINFAEICIYFENGGTALNYTILSRRNGFCKGVSVARLLKIYIIEFDKGN